MKKIYLLLTLLTFTAYAQNYTFTTYTTADSGIGFDGVTDIKTDTSGNLWLVSDYNSNANGIARFDGTTFTNYNTSNSGIPTNMIMDLEIDSQNRKWLATFQNGVVLFNGTTWTNYTTSNSGLPSNSVNDIAIDGSNNIWIGTNAGLTRFNGSTWVTYNTNNSTIFSNNVMSIGITSANSIYIADGAALSKFNGTNFTIITDGAKNIAKISGNELYINTYSGYAKIVNDQYTDGFLFGDNSCLLDCQLEALDLDQNNNVWLGFYSECESGGVQNFTQCQNYTNLSTNIEGLATVGALKVVNSSTIWVGSYSFGLIKMMLSTDSCTAPTNTTVYNLGSTSCIIGWTAPTPAPSAGYEVYLSTSNVTPIATTTPTYTSTTTNVTIASGLTPATSYYAWVRSNCGTQKSNWTPVLNFVTNALTGCTTATYGQWPSATFTPTCGVGSETIVNNAYAGEYSLVNVIADRQYTFTTTVSTDFITITNSANVILASGTVPLVWNSGSFVGVIRYYTHLNANCGEQNVNRIKAVQCSVISPGCGLPTNLTVLNITSNSSRLIWNAPNPAATSYEIYHSISNIPPTTSTAPTITSGGTIVRTVTALTPSTTYYYWIRSNCNGTKSDWVSGGSYTTNPALNCNGAVFGLYPDATFTPVCTGNTELVNADAWAGEFTNVNIQSNKQYTFTSSIATDYITITNAAGTTVFASGVTPVVWNSEANTGLIRYHLNTNVNCGTQGSSRTRSIKCENPSSTCNPPSNFISEVLSSTSAVIAWTPSTSAPNGGYLYVYNTTPTIGGMDGNTLFSNAELNDLLPNTTYYWWVAADCVDSQSDWAFGGSFTTPAAASACWQTVSAGYTHSVGIKTDGTLWAWGDNGYGQLGNGTTTNSTTPTQIGSANNWESISASGGFTIAIKTNGTLWAWGNNTFGQLGDGTTTNRTIPTQIGTATNWNSVTTGEGFALAVKDNGTLWAWGNNDSRQLGDGTTTNRTIPTQIGTATNWQSVAAGSGFSLAVKTNGTLWAWGNNLYGQLGNGTTTNLTVPTQIGSENDWANVAAGYYHSVGRKSNGILMTWGNNVYGQLGDGTYVNKSTPVAVFDQVQSIDAGWNYTVGTTTFGNMLLTGQNVYGQLGDGTIENRNWVSLTNSNDHLQISAGAFHTMSLHTDGSLKVCGLNGQGRLGDGTTTDRNSLTPIACPNTNLGIEEPATLYSLKAYPNPVKDRLTIAFEQEISTIALYNLVGQEVMFKTVNANQTSLEMADLPAGTYLVKVNTREGTETLKVIKQ
jgi:alpha-tubulin suppressor-like RCC1 family protein